MTHRFINADGLVSTGTGVLGHNMFAYCNNNPANNVDSTGERIYSANFIGPIQPWDSRAGDITPYLLYTEHHKKGTTNPSNKNKHQKGQKRKQTDSFGGEKGDSRRKVDRSNKRRHTMVYDDYSISDMISDEFDYGIFAVAILLSFSCYTSLNGQTFANFSGIYIWDENMSMEKKHFENFENFEPI